MPRRVIEPLDRPLLDDLARVHHRRPVAELRDHRQVVRHQDQREPEVAAQAVQELEDLRLHHHVERRRRLVGDQHLRVARERHRDRGALPHPAGELVRETRLARGWEPDRFEQLSRSRPRTCAGRSVVELERLDDLRADGAHRVECVHRTLKDDCHVDPAVWPDRLLAAGEHVFALEPDASGNARVRRQ